MSETEGRAAQDIGQDEAWAVNLKRTYDEFQQESLETIRQMRVMFTKQLTDAQQFDNQRQTISNQALQNAVETANAVAKQMVRHSDLAIDRQWNVDEQGYTAAQILGAPFVEAIKAAVAGAVAEALKPKA
jgi:hypothetical protein